MAVRRSEHRTTGPQPALQVEKKKDAALTTPVAQPGDGFGASAAKIAAKVELPPPTTLKHHWAQPLRDAAHALGKGLHAAGALFHAGGDALDPLHPLGLEAHTLGTQANALATKAEQTANATQVPAKQLHAEAESLHGRALNLVERMRKGATRGIEHVSEGAQAVGHAIKAYVTGLHDALDWKKNIDQLGEDDSYTLGADGMVALAGIAGTGQATLTVTRPKADQYVVSLDGGLGAGLWAHIGAELFGAKAAAEALFTVGGGRRVELTFSDAESTKSAVTMLMGAAARRATLLAPSADQRRLVDQHLSAVVLHGGVVGEALGILGLEGSAFAGAGEGKAKAEETLRLELGGSKPALVLTQTLSAEGGGGLGFTPDVHKEAEAVAPTAWASAKVGVSVSSRWELPKDTPRHASLLSLKSKLKNARAEHSVAFTVGGKGGVLGSGGGVDVKLSMATDLKALKKSGAIGRALHGDLRGALAKLPDSTVIDNSLARYATYGVELSPKVALMASGFELELEAMRKDVDFEHAKKAKTPVREAWKALVEWLQPEEPEPA